MKRIGTTFFALGILGMVACANTLDSSVAAFLVSEGLCFALAVAGAKISNKTAETEAPADNTMKHGTNRIS